MAQQNQNDGWNVVSKAPVQPAQAQGDAWDVVSTTPMQNASTADKLLGKNPVSDTLANVGTHLKNFVAGPYHAFTDAPRTEEEARIKGTNPGSGKVANALGQFGLGASRILLQPTSDAMKEAGNQLQKGNIAPLNNYDAQGNYHPSVQSSLMDAVPMLGPWNRNFQNEANTKGVLPAVAGFATDAFAPDVAGSAVSAARNLPGRAKAALQGPINEPLVPGGKATPASRYAGAKALGVNLDAADATNSGLFKNLKTINQHSLFGTNKYETLHSANVTALGNSTDNILNGTYEGDRESGGQRIQNALKEHHQGLRADADWNYKDLDSQVGNKPIDASELSDSASDILKQGEAYYRQFPSLAPPKTLAIVRDIAQLGKPAVPIQRNLTLGFDKISGKRTLAPLPPVKSPLQPSFANLQALRSDLYDATLKNPDLIPGQGAAWLKKLTGDTDAVMTGASDGLNPSQLATFRQANQSWADAKETFDNAQSPFFSAIRTDSPSRLYGGIGSKTAEGATAMKYRLGPAIDAVQRGTVEGALKTNSDGTPNFKTFAGNLNKIPADYKEALFTAPQAADLNNVAQTGNVLFKDANPSGTAKYNQKLGEVITPIGSALTTAALGRPLAALGELGAAATYGVGQHLLAKGMTSHSAVEWLMAPGSKPKAPIRVNPFIAPVVQSAVNGGRRKSK